ncbi:MAG TPA: methionyl-tRNA formyltransferase [bacterium]
MRIVFCGNPEFALPTLNALLESPHEVLAVVCSPDKPRGRGRKVQPLPVKERALEAGLPVLQPASLKDPEFLEQIRAMNPDCFVVIAFRILPREMFALPRLGSFNVHPSLLPRGRGPAPIRWTLLRGEQETGVTIIHLSETIDGGDILRQERTDVLPSENYGTLHDRLARFGAKLLVEVLDAYARNEPPKPLVQDESLVTKAPKLFGKDFELDWKLTAEEILNRVRAFSPDPGAMTLWNGTRFKILDAEVAEQDGLDGGRLIKPDEKRLLVGTGHGTLKLNSVQPEGKRAMTVAEFLRGRPTLPLKLGE